ncbi:MAG TPA: ArsR family transcriptional regulator [Flavobacteriales bacterium]|nr:ArsR family transcriptional regulator [Flavobacteriales bacterium]
MGSEIETYRNPEAKLASLCRSLAHPTRVAIIKTIAEKQNCVAGEVVNIAGLSKQTVVEHLRSLKKEGIIKGKLSRSSMHYCIDWPTLDEFKRLFDGLYDKIKQNENNVICNNGKCD